MCNYSTTALGEQSSYSITEMTEEEECSITIMMVTRLPMYQHHSASPPVSLATSTIDSCY